MTENTNTAQAVGVEPFTLRADDTRLHLYIDRAEGTPLGDLSLQTVMAELKRRGCVLGKETAAILVKTLAAWRSEGDDPSNVLIATGRLPEHGANGRLEWTPQCDPDRKPGGADAGEFSHYATHLVALNVGDVIATMHRPTRGTPGVDVWGHELPARNGKTAPYRSAAGSHVDEETGHILSDVDGTLDTAGGEIRVTEGLHINGNVDFKTGHVSSPGAVEIDGSVVDLFHVDSGSDVTIHGDVRLAEIRANGTITIDGMLATGEKGICLAGGDISARMIESSTVATWGSIEAAKEVINAALYTGKQINAPHATVSGGIIVGRGGVTAKVLGSDGNVPTLVIAGTDWAIDRLTKPKLAEIEKLQENLEKRMPALNTLRASLKRLTPGQREQVVELEFEAHELQGNINERTAFIEDVKAKSEADTSAVVTVVSEIFGGVELRLGRRVTKIDKPMRGPLTFKLSDIGHGLQIVAETAGGNILPLKTGRVAEPLLKLDLPEIPPDPLDVPEPEAVEGESEATPEEA